MIHVQETDLAWSLIDTAKTELDERERNHVFICVGAGDAFTAIRILAKLIAVKQIPVEPTLAQSCATWLQAYALHEDHEKLQLLIAGFAVVDDYRSPVLPLSAAVAKPPAAQSISTASGRGRGCWINRRTGAGTRIA